MQQTHTGDDIHSIQNYALGDYYALCSEGQALLLQTEHFDFTTSSGTITMHCRIQYAPASLTSVTTPLTLIP